MYAKRTIFTEREWPLAPGDLPPLAAHVVTSRRGYTHHGIYVGGGKVVHYAGLSRGFEPGPVEEVSLADFANGHALYVRPYDHPRFDRGEVVARARSRIGENCYRVLSNNCEHFSEWCVRGEHRSRQVDAWCSWPHRLVARSIRVAQLFRKTVDSMWPQTTSFS